MSERWVRHYDNGSDDYLESVNGVLWYDIPVPPRWHRCKAQTRGSFDDCYVERCRCGAARFPVYPGNNVWLDRNSRRREAGK